MTITPATHAISINPATGEQLSVLPWAGVDDIENALQLAAAGFRDWRETNIDYRAEKLRDIGKALRARSEEMAQMITREMGKPINQARAEVAKSANLCDWYAEHGPAMLKAEPTLVENQQAVIEYRPLGTILAIMPWNFPLWQVMRGAVPIILAGNGYLLKHAPNVMGCAQLIAQVFKDAGIPQGVYGWLNADNDGVSLMIKDSRIAAVTVTGSVRAGAAIGAQAGAALKKCVLELGGSDPFIVLNDADLELAVKAAVAGRYQNTGQVCAAAKRFIIEEGIASAFTERFVAAAAALKMGDPRDEENALGPMARFDLRDELHHQVEKTLAQGARLLLGGEKMAGAGNYYPPTVLANVTPEIDGSRLGIAICTVDGQLFQAGDAQERFSIQSISKVLSLVVAMRHYSEEEIWQRVGKDPSGSPFNSLVQLEMEQGIPRNPFINAGALVVCDMLQGRLSAPRQRMLEVVRGLSGVSDISYDTVVARSEFEHSARNAAIAWLMKSFGNFHHDVTTVLQNYFHYCALKMSCVELARTFVFLANQGKAIHIDEPVVTPMQARQINALMATSGMYQNAGEFAWRVGLPAKSGVGGGIVAIVPHEMAIAVWSPELDDAGNSLAGIAVLEQLTKQLGRSVY